MPTQSRTPLPLHPKNPYTTDYDFDELVKHNETLGKYIVRNKHGIKTIKFGDQRAVKALNKALLKSRYDVHWDIPKGYVCPSIPGRLNYLLHVADLLPKKDIKMLDVGTGANLIYPILGTCHFSWQCTATELHPDSISHAQQTIAHNPALETVDLRVQKDKECILDHIIQPDDKFDVLVCNPPFYKNAEDAQKKNERKVRNLQSKQKTKLNFAGRSSELWTEGGESQFITQLAEESVQFRDQVGLFTALISRMDSIEGITDMIGSIPRTEVEVVDMGLGNKKSRFITWKFI